MMTRWILFSTAAAASILITGSCVPAIIISPYAKRGFVDHTQYDTTSILKFIETR